MATEEHDRRVDYIEFGSADLPRIRAFYEGVFGWKFTDYGPEYTSFSDGRLNGGFTTLSPAAAAGALVVMYAVDLEGVEAAVREHGGIIEKEIFSFPGGRRFHFSDPSGNVLAVWSDR